MEDLTSKTTPELIDCLNNIGDDPSLTMRDHDRQIFQALSQRIPAMTDDEKRLLAEGYHAISAKRAAIELARSSQG
jgi:hypothetical protein